MAIVRFVLATGLILSFLSWGPAAYAQDDDIPTPDEVEKMSRSGSSKSSGKVSTKGATAKSASPKKTRVKVQEKKAGARSNTKAKSPPVTVSPKDTLKEPVKAAAKAKTAAKATAKSKSAAKAKAAAKAAAKANAAAVDAGSDDASEDTSEDGSEDENSANENGEAESELEDEAPEEQDPVKISANARELSIRSLGLTKIGVTRSARRYVPAGLEARLTERLLQDLTAKTYYEPRVLDGALTLNARPGLIQQAAKKNQVQGILILEIGLEEILGTLTTVSGMKIKGFQFRYLVGEMEEKNAVSILSDRIVEGIVQATPYRGFVTAMSRGSATVNLGAIHQLKEGDVLELFEFRRPSLNSTRRLIGEAQVQKVIGPTESLIGPMPGKRLSAEPFAKVSFRVSQSMATEATDHSIVSGRWWIGVGGQLQSLGAEAAAPKYESRLFKVNSAPFGYLSGGNDVWTLQGAFGSARSTSETLNFVDVQGLYSVYQLGGAQSAWNFSAGGRMFLINVVPLPNQISALTTTTVVSPMVEARYNYVPKERVRVGFHGELFWPVYTTGAEIGALVFAFGAGAGVQLQLALTSQLGVEVSGKLRYTRRPIEGQSGVQERQSILGSGFVFSF